MKHTLKRWTTGALALGLALALGGCGGEKAAKGDWIPGMWDRTREAGEPAYSIRYPLDEDKTGVCISSSANGTCIGVADLKNNRIEYTYIDHATGEATHWTTENVALDEIYTKVDLSEP